MARGIEDALFTYKRIRPPLPVRRQLQWLQHYHRPIYVDFALADLPHSDNQPVIIPILLVTYWTAERGCTARRLLQWLNIGTAYLDRESI